jgi:hypothetical protein
VKAECKEYWKKWIKLKHDTGGKITIILTGVVPACTAQGKFKKEIK